MIWIYLRRTISRIEIAPTRSSHNWADHPGLTEDGPSMASELACFEEDFQPVETVLAVFEPAREKLQFKLHRPMAEVIEDDDSADAQKTGQAGAGEGAWKIS